MALFGKFIKKTNTALVPSTVLPTIQEALTKAGFRPTRDTEIRIEYKNEGYFCYFCYREDDPEFLLVMATFERSSFEDKELSLLHRACDKTNYDQKVGKAYIDEAGDVVFTVETFLMAGTPIDSLSLRMSSALVSTIAYYHRTLRQLAEEGAAGTGGSEHTATQLPPSGSLPS